MMTLYALLLHTASRDDTLAYVTHRVSGRHSAVTEFFSTEGLARYLGVPAATVKAWRYKGTGPRGLRVGRHIRYRRTDVERWLDLRADQDRQSTNHGY